MMPKVSFSIEDMRDSLDNYIYCFLSIYKTKSINVQRNISTVRGKTPGFRLPDLGPGHASPE